MSDPELKFPGGGGGGGSRSRDGGGGRLLSLGGGGGGGRLLNDGGGGGGGGRFGKPGDVVPVVLLELEVPPPIFAPKLAYNNFLAFENSSLFPFIYSFSIGFSSADVVPAFCF